MPQQRADARHPATAVAGPHTLGDAVRVEFEYLLTGTGWAEGRIRHGAESATITASYLGDALGDLLTLVDLVLDGAKEADCSWEEEPGEYRWIARRNGTGQVTVQVLWFSDSFPPQPEADGSTVFLATADVEDFAAAIATGARQLLAHLDEDEYLKQWVDHPFPIELLKKIENALRPKYR